MPDKLYKSSQIKDYSGGMIITNLGPEEKIAGNVLKSIKQQIKESREELREVKEEITRRKQEAGSCKQEIIQEAETEAENILQAAEKQKKTTEEQAEQIKSEAQDKADELLAEREQLVDKARQEGYDEGYEDGWEKARRETAELLEHSKSIVEEARREKHAVVAAHKQELIELAGIMAEKIVRTKISLDSQVGVRVIEAALQEISDVKQITLLLNPADYEIVTEIVDDFRDSHPSLEEITLSPDSNMDRGGCRIKADYGDIDGTIRGQLEHYTDQLRDQL